ncbi:MAG: hypothetical protein OXQ84_17775 [bacterium]|nr:hypothetical protein [bacterium]
MKTDKPKVFCVGFHKTGTKSLARALEILGYRVTGPNGARDPRIAERALPMALDIVSRFDAFNDNPWPVLFREMDAAFPGARFILTRRAPETWIASVVRNFGDERTPMREWIYGPGLGAPRGNEGAYLQRYLGHNADVIDHFSGRGCLLTMDITAGDGWERLCGFLEMPLPDRPFPHVNQSEAAGKRAGP